MLDIVILEAVRPLGVDPLPRGSPSPCALRDVKLEKTGNSSVVGFLEFTQIAAHYQGRSYAGVVGRHWMGLSSCCQLLPSGPGPKK